jgi:predicted TIM-barrel fold metal-dependent hydrolase
VCFSELPPWLGLPSIHSGHWDPFFAACSETGTVVAMHIGSGTKTIASSPDAPDAVQASAIFANSALSLIDFLYSGVLVRFPGLRLLYAEAQIGWIPYVLERVDDVWEVHRGWSDSQAHVPDPPSQYYYRQVVGCFFKDSVGIDNLDRVGRGNIAFETDYPHQDGTWPNTEQVAKNLFSHLDAPTVHAIVRGNAIRLLDLELQGHPGPSGHAPKAPRAGTS